MVLFHWHICIYIYTKRPSHLFCLPVTRFNSASDFWLSIWFSSRFSQRCRTVYEFFIIAEKQNSKAFQYFYCMNTKCHGTRSTTTSMEAWQQQRASNLSCETERTVTVINRRSHSSLNNISMTACVGNDWAVKWKKVREEFGECPRNGYKSLWS